VEVGHAAAIVATGQVLAQRNRGAILAEALYRLGRYKTRLCLQGRQIATSTIFEPMSCPSVRLLCHMDYHRRFGRDLASINPPPKLSQNLLGAGAPGKAEVVSTSF
jgi:hypothetical protein